jgi:hypothetical protein
MKLIWALLLGAMLLFALPASADQIDYTYTYNDAGIGTFSWTVETDGFIQPVPNYEDGYHIYDANNFCINCGVTYRFVPGVSSAPTDGDGCQVAGVEIAPDFDIYTYFSPFCGPGSGLGEYETKGGAMPDVGELGTFPWQWTDANDGNGPYSYGTLTISDASAVPEPGSLALLIVGIGLLGLAHRSETSQGHMPCSG